MRGTKQVAAPVAASRDSATVAPLTRDVLRSPGRPLASATRAYFEPRFGHDFGTVRVHGDARAAASAESIGAQAYAAGNHIVLGRGVADHDSPSARVVLAHELAHVVQQRGGDARPAAIAPAAGPAERAASRAGEHVAAGGALRIPLAPVGMAGIQRLPSSLSTIPESERRAMRVGTTSVTVPQSEIDAVFATTGTRTAYNHGGQTVFGTGIDAALQRGLTSVSAYITNQTNGLPLNSTIEVALDLSSHGGANSVYRFTWFAHTENRTTSNVMLIEFVGAATASPTATVPTGSFTANGQTFSLRGTWNESRFGQLQSAINRLPAAAATEAAGLTFRRQSGNGPGAEAGEYDPATDTVTLYDNAFPSDSLRFGGATGGERNILHEIGHAIDLRVLERAWTTFNSGGQTSAGRTTLLNARSPSGSRWVQDAGSGDYNQSIAHDATDGTFRAAVRADGVRRDTSGRTTSMGSTANLSGGVTEYSDTDYQELFAELYSLYMSNRAVLQQLRPRSFAWFQSRYP